MLDPLEPDIEADERVEWVSQKDFSRLVNMYRVRVRTILVVALGFLFVSLWLSSIFGARASIPTEDDIEPGARVCGVSSHARPVVSGKAFELDRPFAEPRWIDHTVLYGTTNRFGNLHTGVDFPAPIGMPLLAVGSGRVIVAGDDARQIYGPRLNYYGQLVIIGMDVPPGSSPLYVLYGHLNQVTVSSGQRVSAGQRVGTVGMTGAAVGPHLHLEMRCGSLDFSATSNPILWMQPLMGRGIIAGRLVDSEGRPVKDDRLLVYRVDTDTQLWRVVRTYPDQSLINSNDAWGENFALTDVPAGEYILVTGRGSGVVRTSVTVVSGRIAFVEISLPTGHQVGTH